jgi:hypothetical protein
MKCMKYLQFLLLLLFGSCYYDDPPEPVEIDPELVYYNSNVVPILARACDSPGCHNTGDIPPDLTAENAYDELVGGGYVNTTLPTSSILYLRITGNSAGALMPPAGRLPQSDIDIILAWIKKGALND